MPIVFFMAGIHLSVVGSSDPSGGGGGATCHVHRRGKGGQTWDMVHMDMVLVIDKSHLSNPTLKEITSDMVPTLEPR
jgi:hypothetical protein